jgi:putative peptidoglycan lipid II flippase
MLPGTIGLAATQINILVNSILASSVGTGAVSWLNYAFRLMQFPIGIFGVSLAAATLPVVAGHWTRGDLPALQRSLQRSVRQVLAINLPAAAGLGFLGVPIIQLIFEHGSFTATDTSATAVALASYALGLAAYSLVKVLVPVTYAMGRARVAVQSSILSVIVNLILNLLLVGPLGHGGLALGTSLTAMLNAGYLMFVISADLKKRGISSPWQGVGGPVAVHTLVALAMGGVCWAAHQGFLYWLGPAVMVFDRLIRLGIFIGIGVGFLLLSAKILRLDDTVEMSRLLWNKVRRKK